jgi:hypothetical protein
MRSMHFHRRGLTETAFHRKTALLTHALPSLVRRAGQDSRFADGRIATFVDRETRLFAPAASRIFAKLQPAVREESQPAASTVTAAAARYAAPPAAASAPLDIERLSEEVYRHIQRKIRIDRERRGISA